MQPKGFAKTRHPVHILPCSTHMDSLSMRRFKCMTCCHLAAATAIILRVSLLSVFSDVSFGPKSKIIENCWGMLGSPSTDQVFLISPWTMRPHHRLIAPLPTLAVTASTCELRQQRRRCGHCGRSTLFLTAHMLGAQNSAQSNQENSSTKPDVEDHCTFNLLFIHMQIYLDI